MGLTLITAPVAEPVTIAEARAQLRVVTSGSPASHPEDDLINGLITASREAAEKHTGRAFVKQVWDLSLDSFPTSSSTPVFLPMPPLISVDQITYTDSAGNPQTWDAAKWQVDTTDAQARLRPAPGEIWPVVQADLLGGALIRFTAGYSGDGASPESFIANVPQAVKQAMLMLITHWFENRGAAIVGTISEETPMAVGTLLWPYRVVTF